MTIQHAPGKAGRGIEWCDETRGPVGGCLHDCKWEMPDGTVAGCYAKELAEHGVAAPMYPHGFEHHYFRPEQLKALTRGKEPLLIFCDSMSDLFAANVPEEDTRKVLHAMRKAPHHTYQSLTKAPKRLLKFVDDFPPNLWVGISSPPDSFMGRPMNRSQQEKMLASSLEVLADIQRRTGNIVWMSAEPVSWDIAPYFNPRTHPLDWIVIGAASNGRKYFQPAAVDIARLLHVMDQTATPVFYKGNIKALIHSAQLGRWREDFPLTYRDTTPIPAVRRRQTLCSLNGWTPSLKYAPRALRN